MSLNKPVSFLKKSLVIVGAVLCLSVGTAQAVSQTGPVNYYFTQPYTGDKVYTFVNIGNTLYCYSTEHGSEYAGIFKTTQIHSGVVTVTCNGQKITQVAN